MYGKTRDEFEYKGTKFRWILSPNKYIYQVWYEGNLIGAIPVSQIRVRNSPEAIKALYPVCDAWLVERERGRTEGGTTLVYPEVEGALPIIELGGAEYRVEKIEGFTWTVDRPIESHEGIGDPNISSPVSMPKAKCPAKVKAIKATRAKAKDNK